jgi:DNA-directed RNA polymerase omega subunit
MISEGRMQDMAIDKLIDKTKSLFKLVVLASRRAQELAADSNKLVESPSGAKIASVALQEIIEGKITYKAKEPKEKK